LGKGVFRGVIRFGGYVSESFTFEDLVFWISICIWGWDFGSTLGMSGLRMQFWIRWTSDCSRYKSWIEQVGFGIGCVRFGIKMCIGFGWFLALCVSG
jgi:hypothetical protein